MKKYLIAMFAIGSTCGNALACGCPFVPKLGFSRGPGQDYGFGYKGCDGNVFAWGDIYKSTVNIWMYTAVFLAATICAVLCYRHRRESNKT